MSEKFEKVVTIQFDLSVIIFICAVLFFFMLGMAVLAGLTLDVLTTFNEAVNSR